MSRLDTFIETYTLKLDQRVRQYPTDYYYGPERVPEVVAKMKVALQSGSFGIGGRAIKETCKALGIKATYKAIDAYLKGENSDG